MLNKRDQAFVDHLGSLADDRAALAALRRGLGKPPGTAPETYPYVVPFLPDGLAEQAEEPYYLVATLFAHWHQGNQPAVRKPPENLGASLAELARRQEARGGSAQSVERRLVALLNSHRDDLGQHLRRIVALLRSHEVPVAWGQFLADIKAWNWPNRRVQRRWASAFWRSAPPRETDADKADQPAALPAAE